MSAAKHSHLLVTGGSGRLATAIGRLADCRTVARKDFDITDEKAVKKFFDRNACDTLLHCAAYTDVAGAEHDKERCYRTNVTGTENILRYFNGKKFVYISTDYVFDGRDGNYVETDIPNPVNFYSLTKLLGEVATRQYPGTLIIRTSFKGDGPWPYPKAIIDLWTSAGFVSDIAPQILEATLMPDLYGTLHISSKRTTVYDLALIKSPNVGTIKRKDVATVLPRDVSLDSSLWRSIRVAKKRYKPQ